MMLNLINTQELNFAMSHSERPRSGGSGTTSPRRESYEENQHVIMDHAERRSSVDSGTESPPQEYGHASPSSYGPAQYHELPYNPQHDNFTPEPYIVPQGYVVPEVSRLSTDYHTPPQIDSGSEHTTKTEPKPHAKIPWFERLNRGWAAEIASELFSVVSLLATVILLSEIDGRPLSSWTIAVSPNAVISILSIAAKASFIYALGQAISQLKWLHLFRNPENLSVLQSYDDASRGPLGAFRMFWVVRSASLVAYLGCLTVILALAFEPFSQQLLHFDERNVAYPDKQSSVSYSTMYDFGDQGVDGVSAVIVGPRDNPMTAAIVNGIYDVVKDPPFDCPGSNCGFPNFTTFGVSSECDDVSSSIVKTKIKDTFEQIWSFRTPGNLTMEATMGDDPHNGLYYTHANSTLRSLSFGLGMPVKIAIIRFLGEPYTDQFTWDNWVDTVQAYECTLSLCGRQFTNWNTTNGTLSHGEERIIKLNQTTTTFKDDPRFRVFTPLDPSDSLGTGDGNNSYVINYQDSGNMDKILVSIFENTDTVLVGNDQIGPTALYSSPDIKATMDNIAKGMSYRMMSGPNMTTIHGEVYTEATYIQVRWPWVALPAALTVASSICLIAVIIMARQARQLIWKSSLMPLLLPEASTDANEGSLNDSTGLLSRTETIVSHLTK
ncbi:hypothetical protein GGR50DRAFT_657839 [Xylaria sp. CBS 124048]|nr:hypothetical protein GGR50DRAFT_657839 [Xylaria sp. CBS 124048]